LAGRTASRQSVGQQTGSVWCGEPTKGWQGGQHRTGPESDCGSGYRVHVRAASTTRLPIQRSLGLNLTRSQPRRVLAGQQQKQVTQDVAKWEKQQQEEEETQRTFLATVRV